MNDDKLRPCAECGRTTRPTTSKISEYPDIQTIVRRGDLCDACHRSAAPVVSEASRASFEYNLAGLNSFLARRHEREDMMARRENYEQRISA